MRGEHAQGRCGFGSGSGPGVSKSAVSRALACLRPSFEAWKKRDLTELKVKRLIPDGKTAPVRLDGKSRRMTNLVAIGQSTPRR